MAIQEIGITPDIPIFYKGNFDMEPIYRACINWMKHNQVTYIYEDLYKEKEVGPGIVDKEIKLTGEVKLDEFRKWKIKIIIKSSDTKTLEETMPNGNPIYHGRMEISLGSSLEIDYQDAFASQSFIVSNMRKIMQTVWNRGNPGKEIGTLAWKLQILGTDIKKHLGLEVT